MTPELRRQLQRELQRLNHREAENVSAPLTFLPLWSHRMALRPETVVVRGGRGAGKSALFHLLRDLRESPRLRAFFQDPQIPEARWVDAFSQLGTLHPSVESLDDFGRTADDDALRVFWVAHLLARLQDEVEGAAEWLPEALRQTLADRGHQAIREWVAVAGRHVGELSAGLDAVERRLGERERYVFATYDHLDRIGSLHHQTRSRYIRALLVLWLSLSNRYRWLRAKIFLREDLFDPGRLGFPDATKLRARSASLEWDVESLYRVVVRHMAAQSAEMRAWLEGTPGLELQPVGEFGFLPGPMPESVVKAFATRLAGELMGSGVKKGYTYRWIPNRLQDAQIHVVPRSMLTLVGVAAESGIRREFPAESPRLLAPQDLSGALPRTSEQRVAEVQEEYPLAGRLENLRGQLVMMPYERAVALLGRPAAGEPEGGSTDGAAVVEELIALGVLARRKDGRIDVPDIYRYGFGIKRKGGVARPK